MTVAIAQYLLASTLPPVPSAVPIYKSTQTTDTNENTTVWTGLDIGVPHPKRLVIVAFYGGVANFTAASINGIDHCTLIKAAAHECGIFAFQVPTREVGVLALTCVTSLRKAASVYVAYPDSWLPIDSGTDSATFTADAVVSDLQTQKNGFAIYVGIQHAATGDFSTTWGGTDSVTEDVDAQIESTSTYTMGHFANTYSSSADDLTLAESVSGTKRLCVATWGPPRLSTAFIG